MNIIIIETIIKILSVLFNFCEFSVLFAFFIAINKIVINIANKIKEIMKNHNFGVNRTILKYCVVKANKLFVKCISIQ